MIKIMHIAQADGGVENYLEMLLPKMNADEYHNILLCSNEYHASKFIDQGMTVEQFEMEQTFNPIKLVQTVKKVRNFIRQYEPDVLYLHSTFAGVYGRLANRGLNVKCIYNAHGWAFNMDCIKPKRKVYLSVEKMFAKNTDKLVAISDYERESALTKHVCDADKIITINNGVQLNGDDGLKDNQINDDVFRDKIVIGMVGRFCRQKAPDTFVKMAKQVSKKIDNAYFIMVGDGEERADVEHLIEKSQIQDRVLITGWVDYARDYVQKFDVGVLLSRWEGFGLAVAEYMAESKPVVVTNVDALLYLVENNQSGYIVEKDDYMKAAELVVELCKDEKKRLAFGQRGRIIAQEMFDIQRVVDETEQIIKDVVSN